MKHMNGLKLDKAIAIIIGMVSTTVGANCFGQEAPLTNPLAKLEAWISTGSTPDAVVTAVNQQMGIDLNQEHHRREMMRAINAYRAIVNSEAYLGKNGFLGDQIDDDVLMATLKDSISRGDSESLQAMNAAIMVLER